MKSSPICLYSRPGCNGFTLVEMLVAVAVLGLMTLLMFLMFSAANETWLQGRSRVDNFSKARVLTDLLSEDLQRGVYRSDLTSFPGSSVAFYTLRSGFSAGSNPLREISLVTYVLQTNNVLGRGDLSVAWNDPASAISFGITNSLPNSNNVTMRDAAQGVLAFQILFIDSRGSLTNAYASTNGLKGFAIGLVVIDENSARKLGDSELEALRTGLKGALSGTNSLKADWENYLATGLNWSRYPKNLGGSIKTFERYVYLPQ